MNELVDLTKILKVGDKVYSVIFGKNIEILKISKNGSYCIDSTEGLFTEFGQYKPLGECLIFPSKTQRDWKKYIKDLENEKRRSELLDKAIKDYPIGTKINTITFVGKAEVTGIPEFSYSDDNSIIEVKCIGGVNRYLYHNEKWAEIIKEPMFITEDRVEIYDIMTFVFYIDGGKAKAQRAKLCVDGGLYFSSESDAEDYVSKNKKLSLTPEQKAEIIELIKLHR